MVTEPKRPPDIARIGVLGAGTMGAGIAQVAAEAGIDVQLHDPLPGAVGRARTLIAAFLTRKVEKRQLSADTAAVALKRIHEATDFEALAEADLVIEAIPEDLELKRDAFRRLDAAAPLTTILATNTSSLSVAQIALATAHPERVLGMHFFNPVPAMALVELIPGPLTDPAVTDAALEAVRRLGKTAVMAADTPGFIVNRVARPFYLEALRIVGEGSAGIEQVDAAMRAVGFRMGPFELVDAIGADVNLAVSQSVFESFSHEPRYAPHPIQEALVTAGRLGRKTGGGFYDYAADGARGAPWTGLGDGASQPMAAEAIAARILATIVNEAASAVADGVATPDAVDLAMRLGTNYPQGPLAWGEQLGLASVVRTLDELHARQPDGRYAVVPLLRSLAGQAGSFFASGR